MRDVVFRGKNVVFPLQSEANDGFVVDENAAVKTQKQDLSTQRYRDGEEKQEGIQVGNAVVFKAEFGNGSRG